MTSVNATLLSALRLVVFVIAAHGGVHGHATLANDTTTLEHNEVVAVSDVNVVELSKVQWTWLSASACIVAVCCSSAIPLICAIEMCVKSKVICADAKFRFVPKLGTQGDYQVVSPDNKRRVYPYLKGEMLCTLALPFVASIATYIAGHFGADALAKPIGAALVALFMVRVILRDCELARELSGENQDVIMLLKRDLSTRFPACPYTMSKLEVLDAISDGSSLAIVRLAEETNPIFSVRLVTVWQQSNRMASLLTPGVEVLGLSGLMLGTLAFSTIWQLGASLDAGSVHLERDIADAGVLTEEDMVAATQADVAGLGECATMMEGQQAEFYIYTAGGVDFTQAQKKCSKCITRVVGEGLPQLIWQSSALMATGNGIHESPILAMSLAVTLATTSKKGVDLLLAARKMGLTRCYDMPVFVGNVVFAFAIICFCAYFMLRIIMQDVCKEHAWNLAVPPMAGCVEGLPVPPNRGG